MAVMTYMSAWASVDDPAAAAASGTLPTAYCINLLVIDDEFSAPKWTLPFAYLALAYCLCLPVPLYPALPAVPLSVYALLTAQHAKDPMMWAASAEMSSWWSERVYDPSSLVAVGVQHTFVRLLLNPIAINFTFFKPCAPSSSSDSAIAIAIDGVSSVGA